MTRRAGFTLLETLAVVVGLALVLTAVVGTYVAIQDQSAAAAEATAPPRRATALLDRMSREIAAATLIVKPPEVDPIDHPWVFLAERRLSDEGADRVRFQTRNGRPAAREGPRGDLVDVAYWLAPAADGAGFDLLRWSSSQLPERLERGFPRRDDDGVEVWARSLAGFGLRWLAEDGNWVEEWDSSTLARSSQLPLAAEIRITLPAGATGALERFSRRVLLALRPIDLAARLGGPEAPEAEGAGATPDAGTDGVTDADAADLPAPAPGPPR